MTNEKCSVTGIDSQFGGEAVTGLSVGTGVAYVMTLSGPIVAQFNQYVIGKEAQSIHLSGQLRQMGHQVEDVSLKAGGEQCIQTKCGLIIPLAIWDGRPFMDM